MGTKEDDIQKVTKEQDVKYKTQEAAGLDKRVSETSSDLDTVTEELNAVLETLEKLHKMCDEKVESYATRKQRREDEIAGLKQALDILNNVALIQKTTKHTLRGTHRH